jgi:hypothetical protein
VPTFTVAIDLDETLIHTIAPGEDQYNMPEPSLTDARDQCAARFSTLRVRRCVLVSSLARNGLSQSRSQFVYRIPESLVCVRTRPWLSVVLTGLKELVDELEVLSRSTARTHAHARRTHTPHTHTHRTV